MSIARIPKATKPTISRNASGSQVVLQPRGIPGPPGAGATDAEIASFALNPTSSTRAALNAAYAGRSLGDLIAGRFPLPAQRKILGPVVASPDTATVTTSASPDGSYNKSYVISGGARPSDWPVDEGSGAHQIISNFSYSVPLQQVRLWRFFCDGTKFALRTNAVAPGDSFQMFVNGAPTSLSLTAFGTGGTFTTVVFSDARPRLIEILTTAGLQAVYTANPYRCWAPPPLVGPKVLLVGDSYSAGVTMNGSDSTQSPPMNGFAPTMGLHLGIDRWITDGIGGTGYIEDSAGGANYVDRLASHVALEPDVIIVGGGGANDRFANAHNNAAVIAAATTYFTEAREALPDAKLVFMEGFAPPAFVSSVATIAADYVAIRTALQSALEDVGVYYIDIATSAAWIDGTGKVGATTGTGNSDVYIGGDGTHLTIAGHRYIKERLAPKLRAVLADQGDLVNELI